MYESFFGLRERPFNLLPDPKFLFLSKQHTEALAHLQYGLTGRPGVTLLIGDAGTGKTTLVRKALEVPPGQNSENHIVQISNPTLTRNEFYEYLAASLMFSDEAARSKPRFLFELEEALRMQKERGVIAVVVDEAQSMPHDLLEEVRLLTNLQTVDGRALTMVLVGQPELSTRLNEGRLRQLKQRVALRCELRPLDLAETLAYVAKRISVAGGVADRLFTRAAVAHVHERAQGIPRIISVICDNALVSGFAANEKPIGPGLIDEVCRDFHIGEAVESAPVPAIHPRDRHDTRVRRGIFGGPESDHASAGGEAMPDVDRGIFAGYSRKKRFGIF
jgi:general secretion pathway protein A